MRNLPWLILVGILSTFAALVYLFPFEGPIALTIHFARTSLVMAVLIVYLPKIRFLFKSVPPPFRDYLLAGIIINQLSNELFSIWNEVGRVFDVDTSIFTSPLAGFFSLLLVISGICFLKAAATQGWWSWTWVLVVSVLFSTGLVFIAPLFR